MKLTRTRDVSPTSVNAPQGDGIGPTGRSIGETPSGDVTLGSGGCTAVALSKLCGKHGVFTSVEETKGKFDAQIPIYSSMVRADLRTPEFVGVPGDRWHPDVVKRAVIDRRDRETDETAKFEHSVNNCANVTDCNGK